MREILFRGKRSDNGLWVYGDLRQYSETHKGIYDYDLRKTVKGIIPATVGQYIGKTDRYDEKIFDGDVVEYKNDSDERGKIVYNEDTAMYEVEFDTWVTDFDHIEGFHLEVIGNIHDDPEFLD